MINFRIFWLILGVNTLLSYYIVWAAFSFGVRVFSCCRYAERFFWILGLILVLPIKPHRLEFGQKYEPDEGGKVEYRGNEKHLKDHKNSVNSQRNKSLIYHLAPICRICWINLCEGCSHHWCHKASDASNPVYNSVDSSYYGTLQWVHEFNKILTNHVTDLRSSGQHPSG